MALRIPIPIALGLLTFIQVTYQIELDQCDHGDIISNGFTSTKTEALQWLSIFGPGPVLNGFPPGDDCYFLANGGIEGFKVLLVSPCLTTSNPRVNLSFSYYLSESNTGELNLYWQDGCSDQPPVLPDANVSLIQSLSDDTKNTWVDNSHEFNVNAEFQIMFEAVMKYEKNNSIAINDISIADASVYSPSTTDVETIRNTMSPVPSSAAASITEMDSLTGSSTISERATPDIVSDNDATTMAITMTTSDVYVVTTPNITLNFCEMHSITNGLDNCTFIGLMFAGVPLVIIFLLWLACYVYNRYCRNCITDPEKQQRRDDDQDGENRKDSYSANYAYVNSVTDHTYASVHPFGNGLPDEETKDKKDGLDDKKMSSGNDNDIPGKNSNGQNGSVGEVKSSPKDTRLPKDSDVLIVAGSDDADSDYTALNPTASEKSSKDDAQEEENKTSTYAALKQSSPSESNETSTPENVNKTSDISATAEESPYFVLEGPNPPSPPSTPVPTLRRNKGVNNDEIVYDLLNDNVPQAKTEKAEDESLYFKLAGPTPPSPPNSPHPAIKEPFLTEKYPKEDEYDLLTSESPKEDEYDLLDRGHPLFTAKVDSDKHVNEPVTSDSDESIDGFVENNDEAKPDKDRNMNETYNGIYDRPRIPAVRALGVDDSSIDSDVSEDTYM